MLFFAIAFCTAAVLVLVVRKPVRPPFGSPEYRWDERVVATILMLIAIGFAAMAWLT
jgi:hypothetical protein